MLHHYISADLIDTEIVPKLNNSEILNLMLVNKKNFNFFKQHLDERYLFHLLTTKKQFNLWNENQLSLIFKPIALFIDKSNREFRNNSVFEYMIWSYDINELKELLNCLPSSLIFKAYDQWQQFQKNKKPTPYGHHYDFSELLNGYDNYKINRNFQKIEDEINFFIQSIGPLQRSIPNPILELFMKSPFDTQSNSHNPEVGYFDPNKHPPMESLGKDFALIPGGVILSSNNKFSQLMLIFAANGKFLLENIYFKLSEELARLETELNKKFQDYYSSNPIEQSNCSEDFNPKPK